MDPESRRSGWLKPSWSTTTRRSMRIVRALPNANLYQEGSMLTFEGQHVEGSSNIVAMLTSLPFQQCHHSITTVDCQPSGPAGGMLVFVSGEQHALKFSQMFHLMPTPQGSFYVFNDVFRLNYA